MISATYPFKPVTALSHIIAILLHPSPSTSEFRFSNTRRAIKEYLSIYSSWGCINRQAPVLSFGSEVMYMTSKTSRQQFTKYLRAVTNTKDHVTINDNVHKKHHQENFRQSHMYLSPPVNMTQIIENVISTAMSRINPIVVWPTVTFGSSSTTSPTSTIHPTSSFPTSMSKSNHILLSSSNLAITGNSNSKTTFNNIAMPSFATIPSSSNPASNGNHNRYTVSAGSSKNNYSAIKPSTYSIISSPGTKSNASINKQPYTCFIISSCHANTTTIKYQFNSFTYFSNNS